jgi:predicted nucleic acid-binding protein
VALIVLDTDVVSLYRAGRLPAGLARQVTATHSGVAFATAAELWKGALTRRWGAARRGGLDLWLAGTTVLPAGLVTAQTWAEISSRAQRRGRPRPFHDTWIAACCLERQLPLLTLNRRDFADFAEHDGLVLLGP